MGTVDRVGAVLGGKYRLVELLGSGAMGDVYRAVNEAVGRNVAIKVMKAESAENPDLVERFFREARVANQIRHPNVCDILDSGRDEGGLPYLVEELLAGETLAEFLQKKGGKVSVERAVSLVLPVIDALAEAHARGITHRDIKPDNIFLTGDREKPIPKVLDFGISKMVTADMRATGVGVMLGTPAYMPPEQIQAARDADCRSDVWAVGVMLFEMITGRLPFNANEAPALFFAIATKDAPTMISVDPTVHPVASRIVERCLRRKPDDRYPSAAELARDLRHMLANTDLEPTQRRSIVPLRIPDLMLGAKLPVADTPAIPRLAPPPIISGLVDAPAPALAVTPSNRGRPPMRRPMAPANSARSGPDMSGLVGTGAVVFVALVVLGILMQIAHRPDGWPVGAFFSLAPTPIMAIHGGLALVCAGLGLGSAKRGVAHFRGDLAGGYVSAGIGAVVGAAFVFAAVELISAIG